MTWRTEYRPSERDILVTRDRDTDPLVVVRPCSSAPDARERAEEAARIVAAALGGALEAADRLAEMAGEIACSELCVRMQTHTTRDCQCGTADLRAALGAYRRARGAR